MPLKFMSQSDGPNPDYWTNNVFKIVLPLVLSTGLFVCLSVCLSVAKMRTETRFSQKTKQSKAMVSIDDLHRLFKVTRHWIPKIQDGGRSQIVFGHSSAADSPISVKFCAAKHIFTEFR